MKRVAVFISGSGSNLQALIDAVRAGELAAEIVLVVSNRKAAYGLVRAEQAEIPTLYFPLKVYRDQGLSRETYDADLAERVGAYKPDLIVLAGWMHIFGTPFLDQFSGKIINLHPALPGQFDGTRAIERAFEAFQDGQIDHTGVMVHWVVPQVDAGPVITAAEVPIQANETLADLEARIHATEHRLLVAAVKKVIV